MSVRFAVPRQPALVTKGGALAAATVLAGAGLFGVATAGPQNAGTALTAVHANVALTDFPTFSQSLQTLLDDMGWGDLNAVLGGFGTFTIDTPVALFLAGLNPNGDTLNGVAEIFGVSLSEPLYSSNPAVDSILGTGSLFLVDGVPIGNVGIGDLIDVMLGDGAGEHSLTDLANAVGLGSLFSQYAPLINAGNWLIGGGELDNYNVVSCPLTICDPDNHPALNTNNSLYDWLSGFLKVNTTDISWSGTFGSSGHEAATTLGEYLHILPVSATDSTTMDNATLGQLFGMPPTQPWDEYVSNFPFGGTLFDPSGETWGEQTLGTFLSSFLPDDSTLAITGDTPITDILDAFGLLSW